MAKKIIPILLLIAATAVNAQHHRHSTAQFLVKPHTSNTTTAEQDSIKGGLGLLVGAIDKEPSVKSDSLFYITGTGVDTSFVYRTWPYMGFMITANDTSSGGDSVGVRIKFYFGAKSEFFSRKNESKSPVPFGFYAVIDSVDITSETPKWYYLGDVNSMPPGSWFYVTVTGLSGNKTASAVSVRINAAFYDDTKIIR